MRIHKLKIPIESSFRDWVVASNYKLLSVDQTPETIKGRLSNRTTTIKTKNAAFLIKTQKPKIPKKAQKIKQWNPRKAQIVINNIELDESSSRTQK